MELRVLLIASAGACLPLGLARLLARLGLGAPQAARALVAAAPLGAAAALRFALHGSWAGWPPHDAGEVFAWLAPALLLGSLTTSIVGWVLPVVVWAWLALEPYRTVHWVGQAPSLRVLGVAAAVVFAAAACLRGLGREGLRPELEARREREGAGGSWAGTLLVEGLDLSVLGATLLGAAILLGHSTGSGALTLGGLGLCLGVVTLDGWVPGAALAGRARFRAAVPGLAALASAALVQGIFFASVPVGPSFVLLVPLGLLAASARSLARCVLRSALALVIVGAAVVWGWPPPDPYQMGW